MNAKHCPTRERGYFAHAASLTDADRAAQARINPWLPDRIVDAHAHCGLPEHVRSVSDRAMGHMLSTFTAYTLEQSRDFNALLHPGKEVRTLRFAKTFRGLNHRAVNDYLLAESPSEDRVAVFGLPEDREYTLRILEHPRAAALKMYYAYLEPVATRVYEAFPVWALEAAEALGKPIILHVPTMIVRSVGEVEEMCARFPRLKVSIAHLGSTKFPVPELEETYARLARLPNVWMDTSLNPSPAVVSMALEALGVERVMYGSDEPLHLIRSKPYDHPQKGQRIAADYPYHWVDPAEQREYGHLAADAPHAHWTCLEAIRRAVEGLPAERRERAKARIFRENAEALFGF